VSREDDYATLNSLGQTYRLHVAFLDEIRIVTDVNMRTEPVAIYPSAHNMVPYRPTVVMGPHRIGFAGEPLRFYGGYSYGRWREAAINHSWTATGTSNIMTTLDTTQVYPNGPQPAIADITWDTPGNYEVSLSVGDQASHPHVGKRKVCIYPAIDYNVDGNMTNTDVIQVSSITGGIEQGGWNCSIKLIGDLSYLLNAREVQGYIPVVVWAEPWWETGDREWTQKAIGLNWQPDDYRDDPRIVFSGYLNTASIEIDDSMEVATFECRTADMLLEQIQTGTYGFFENVIDGKGIIFNDLQTHDVIRHMLQEHTNWIDWHDTRLFYTVYNTVDDNNVSGTQMEYQDWTFNAGMYWSNIRDIAANQFERAWVTPQGCLIVMPDRNMWFPEVWYRNPNRVETRLPLEAAPVGIVAKEYGTNVAVPMKLSVSERLTGDVAYYKIIASLSYMNQEWGADWPQGGTPYPTSGRWVLVQGKYYSDDDKTINWENLWKFAARGYAASNAHYSITLVYGFHTYWRPGDIIEVLYEDPSHRLNFAVTDPVTNWFEVEQITYEPNIEAGQWRTTYVLRELTTYAAPTPTIPPLPPDPEV
jgi:hypothetical protein